jgi:ATP-dependent exoDNAse (exonuclease V) alpha subunit
MNSDRISVKMDGKTERVVMFDPQKFRQFDHGYAVTSHSSQGLTAGRVLVNIDTDSSRSLINDRLAYVAISRASDDARIYTNNAETLGERLATDISKTAALTASQNGLNVAGRQSPPANVSTISVTSHKLPEIDLEAFGLGL